MADKIKIEHPSSGLEGEIVYKPCKNCKSLNYDNADCKDPTFTKDDKILFEPNKCDQCDFELVIPDSPWEH